jgi:hypothetical protein
MRCYGMPIWPPKWSPTAEPKNKVLIGELGTLIRVSHATTLPNACHLYIAYEGREYMGTLLIQDTAFCRHVYFVLHHHLGCPIKEIGSLDLSYTL